MRSEEDFTAAALAANPNSIAIVGSESERREPLWDHARSFGYRNNLRVLPLGIEVADDPRDEQIDDLLEFMKRRPAPLLLVDIGGVRAGKMVAAYRLRAMKLPLEEVLRLAALDDAPEDNAEKIRDFARRYHAHLEVTTTPATAAAPK